jgi:hypothetical protein
MAQVAFVSCKISPIFSKIHYNHFHKLTCKLAGFWRQRDPRLWLLGRAAKFPRLARILQSTQVRSPASKPFSCTIGAQAKNDSTEREIIVEMLQNFK